VRFAFRQLPAATGGLLTPRPVVDVWMEGIDVAPLGCLVDSGALRTRFSRELAEIAGIEPDDSAAERLALAGQVVTAAPARTTLRLGEHAWDAAVWFCDPWPFSFQLLGLDGFLRHFRVTLAAYEEWLDCEPA
jgi:Aspartyl protease